MNEIILYGILYFSIGTCIFIIHDFFNAKEITISDMAFNIIMGGLFGVIAIPIYLLSKFFTAKFWHKTIWKK